MSKNPLFPYDNYIELLLDNFRKEEALKNFKLRKMICRFWQTPLEFHLFSVARRGPCLMEWNSDMDTKIWPTCSRTTILHAQETNQANMVK